MEMTDGYPFVFVMNDKSVKDDVLEYALQYRFKSLKSHHTYIVRVERYIFIGAEDEKDEMGETTRRYRVYRSFVADNLSNRFFSHHRNNELSLYTQFLFRFPLHVKSAQ